MTTILPYSEKPQPGTWHTHDGQPVVICPECATANRVQVGREGTAWVLCANDFCTWRAWVRLGR